MPSSVRIYKPAKSAMQSGKRNTLEWVLEPEVPEPVAIDPLMGWTGSGNTENQVRLTFATLEEAVAYAQRMGLAYTVLAEGGRRPVRRSYADNFKFGRIGRWTH